MYGIAVLVLGFVGSVITIPIIIKLFTKHGIVDSPGARKSHYVAKPTMGGLAIYVGFLLAVLTWNYFFATERHLFAFTALATIFVIGLADDLFALRARYKFIGQTVASFILIWGCDVRLTSFYGVFGIGELPYIISVILTFFTLIVITNSINLIDGIDGLAGSICLSVCLFVGVWFFSVGATFEAVLANALAGGIIAFLIYNWFPSKIFMGDTGSLVLGFTVAWLIIRFIDFNSTLPSTEEFQVNAGVSLGIASIVIPLFDTLRVFTIRVTRNKSPFSPDKNHLHHIILKGFKLSHGSVSAILFGINLSFLAVAWQLRKVNDNIVLAILFMIISVGYLVLTRKMRTMNEVSQKKQKLPIQRVVQQ